MFVKKFHTYVQNVNSAKLYRNRYSLPLYIVLHLQKYSSFAKCNFSISITSQCTKNALIFKPNLTCQRLKTTKAGEEEKKSLAIVKYEKQPDGLRLWKFGGVVDYLKSHAFRNTFHELATKPIHINYNTIKAFCVALKRDTIFSQRYLKSRLVNRILAANDMSLGECFDAVAESHANDVMIYFENTRWTYKQVEILTNKIINYFLSLNYEKGDVVALMVTNRPEYLILMLGLSKIGVIAALIDTNFKDCLLVHSIQLSDCKGLVVSDDLLPEFNKVKNKINSNIELFQLDGLLQSTNFKNLADALITSPDRTPEILCKLSRHDPLVYIYTLTASGLPQVAMLTHSKFIENSIRITYLLNLTITDIIYDPIPLYYTTGLTAGIGPAIIFGVPVVIRRQFSATKYWSDCRKYKCTVGQYVGDICKKLLSQPQDANDRNHNLKKMLGSGLNHDVWKEFVLRFNVEVAELYGITSNNTGKANTSGPIHSENVIDLHAPEPVQNVNGPNSGNGETKTFKAPAMPLDFYNQSLSTNSDHLKEEDNTSRADVIANLGKLKSSYCWKGETISTRKVESVINYLTRPSQCAVYGVSIPNVHGEAGMAIIADPAHNIDLNTLSKEIKRYLPNLACPVFLRLTSDPELLLTVKARKNHFANEGFNPAIIKDELYYIDKNSDIYKPLTKKVYQKILNNQIIF